MVVAPTVGGNDQPEDWYQTNEITRLVANRIGGRASYLFAPALPGPDLYPSLLNDPTIQRVLHLWPRARCALMGVGAPPLMRSDIPRFVPVGSDSLRSAVGDVCSRFYDRAGQPVDFDGHERLIAIELEMLRHIPVTIAVAVGKDKIDSIIGGALGGYFNQLVTDPGTAILDSRSPPMSYAEFLCGRSAPPTGSGSDQWGHQGHGPTSPDIRRRRWKLVLSGRDVADLRSADRPQPTSPAQIATAAIDLAVVWRVAEFRSAGGGRVRWIGYPSTTPESPILSRL